MLVLEYNSTAVRSGGGKRKAGALVVVEDEHSREEKRARQVNQNLIEASRKGDLGGCVQAIRDGADVACQSCGLSALFYAAFYGHDMIVEYLVNCGANVNEKNLTGVTPLGKQLRRVVRSLQCNVY